MRPCSPPLSSSSARWRTLAEAEQTTVARLRGTLPAQLSGLLRGDLDWIVMRCLEKDRTRRYDTANGLAMDIQRHLRNEPVVARPPSTAYLLQKLVRRHRVGFAAAGIVLGVVILGAITTAAQATRALRAERDQNALRDAARLAKEQEATARHAAEAEQLRNEKQRWAREHLLPEINRLLLDLDIAGAFAQALEAEKYVPDDPNLIALWPRLSIVTSIETTPAGAEIYARCGGRSAARALLGSDPDWRQRQLERRQRAERGVWAGGGLRPPGDFARRRPARHASARQLHRAGERSGRYHRRRAHRGL